MFKGVQLKGRGVVPVVSPRLQWLQLRRSVASPLRCGSKQRPAPQQSAVPNVTVTIYSPVSENLNFFEPVTGDEAEGNCVVVRRGGKQPKAKDRSQTDVNSIRCANVTSLLVSGEACAMMRDLNLWHPPVIIELRTFGHGWSGNVPKEVYVSGESCPGRQSCVHMHRAHSVQQSEPPYERRSLVTRMEQREAGK